ncbi:MAG: 2,3-bisphosphoglycerate-independent phosphoglycerate mutase [Gammaproteobacteria bacterium]|jgi:2,3-bisphosphoglycerate-independent phosphoglycerate mutase|nr:2,3-bisphosphoglycerate-independent phosphoglycerate mutase [Gammaproteobacteria bacterium]MBT6454189.1 2,3-bisphosphoglycerate-independent phosphoglycerate mutase [Gammaproteobacteria bacterium]MBT6553279.1 2,3-bisphosphoglycerate-independent phosphoglycerate mutase [Gammaproteobacteria bacterium]MBT7045094.1 2,3-bisphosphoglycerate-independent phosphoglycerate mutase [Gammaproteobacteria bacterium]
MPEARSVPRRPSVLIILDGFGLNPSKVNNAVIEAKTPNFDRYFSSYSHIALEASGAGVGLPVGQMGNSEVGHMTIGCGSVVKQDLVRIDEAIENKSFFKNPAFLGALERCKVTDRPMNLIGLLSDGGVHSHINHLLALIKLCSKHHVTPQVHLITDGRDAPPKSAMNYIPDIELALSEYGGVIGTVSGRYHTMDRDRRWARTELAWKMLVKGEGNQAKNITLAIQDAYDSGETDEFIKPTTLPEYMPVEENDEFIFFNFRNDRSRQMTAALCHSEFNSFERGDFKPITVTCMTQYDPEFLLPIAFPPEPPKVMLGSIVSQAGYRQFHCAETEKYPHVTFFFNGGREHKFPGEDRKMIPSPDVSTYDLKPEMNAKDVADAMIDALKSKEYGFLVVNFANGDMVGHTAVRDAVIKAVETLDQEVGRVLDVAVEEGYSVILTADHGNCDEMVDPITGEPHTQHTIYPVPCLIIDEVPWRLATGGNLSAIAPTLLQLMGIEQPKKMKGKTLLLEEYTV